MDEHILSRTIEILENASEFFVPVKKLWLTLQEEGMIIDIDLPSFYNMLLHDERFEFTPGMDHELELDVKFVKDQFAEELETLGLYSGPCVKLASREMTAEDIFAGLAQSLTRMNKALQNAWDSRPEQDQETEDQLLEILAAGQKLEREVRGLIEGHEKDTDLDIHTTEAQE